MLKRAVTQQERQQKQSKAKKKKKNYQHKEAVKVAEAVIKRKNHK